MQSPLSLDEFERFQRLVFASFGIHLPETKQALVSGRLARRLDHHGLSSFGDYLRLIEHEAQDDERQLALELLTTSDTSFFRETRQFDTLRVRALAMRGNGRTFRAWSAACGSGEESYSIAMVMADCLGRDGDWEVFGSDASARLLEQARQGRYAPERLRHAPPDFVRRFCTRTPQGMQVGVDLRARMHFAPLQLQGPLPDLGLFDVIFLRHALLFADGHARHSLVERVAACLRPGALLLSGQGDNFGAPSPLLEQIAASTYRRR